MAGVVTVAGLFPAGSVVDLVQVAGEHVLRAEGSPVVGRRVVDAQGLVGFDGLETGARFLLRGYAEGRPLEVRLVAVDGAAPDAEIAQPPIGQLPVVVGTQNEVVTDPPPAVPPGLPVGVPVASMAPASPVSVEVTSSTVPVTLETTSTSAVPVVTPTPEYLKPHLLYQQAVGLGVVNAESLTVDELRQSITEKNATPVA